MSLIEVSDLTKVFKIPNKHEGLAGAFRHLLRPQYSEKVAIEGIDLVVEKGESVAYLGSNGAGKSTTIKILTGILTPSSGTVKINGLIPYQERMRHVKNIGVVFGHRTHLWWDLPVIESFKLLRSLYAIPDAVYCKNLEMFSKLLGLEEFLSVAVRRLSLGQRMRADLAAALLHEPPLVFLDEPTVGLDVDVKDTVRRFVRHINRENGTTVMLTSHDMTDIEDLCERLIILERGKKIYDGGLLAIKEMYAKKREIVVKLRTAPEGKLEFEKEGISFTFEGSHTIRVHFDRATVSAAKVVEQIVARYDVADFELREPGVEEIVRNIYSGKLNLKLSPVGSSNE